MTKESSPLLSQSTTKRGLTDSNSIEFDQEIGQILPFQPDSSDADIKYQESQGGDRLMFSDYTTIDWLDDLVKDSARTRNIRSLRGLRGRVLRAYDAMQGWIAAGMIGFLTAVVASVVDIAVATAFDWKEGYCSKRILWDRDWCIEKGSETDWIQWTEVLGGSEYGSGYIVYTLTASLLALSAGLVTLTTRKNLPSSHAGGEGKLIYTAAGSGIPEIKTILCGFIIKSFLSLKTLIVKCIGCVGATGAGLCLAKEGPFVHVAACISWLVGGFFPKYANNDRKRRELLAAGTGAGLSVAFGAPIGGVLFAMEEISSFFPAKVLWRCFFCSLIAATTLRTLNPSGTGRLVMFQVNYDSTWTLPEMIGFAGLGLAGGVFGGLFCRCNYLWSKWFRGFRIIKQHQVFEVFLLVLLTSLLQYPNAYTRLSGDKLIGEMLKHKNPKDVKTLASGVLIKFFLTTTTFGIKVPSGIIIPSLDAGAMFGRLCAILFKSEKEGAFAIVGAAAFLGGVSRMTVSLCVIMIELTGSLEWAVPCMLAILVSKWVADAISASGVYDLAQDIMGHPFLHQDASVVEEVSAIDLCPPQKTMDEITIHVEESNLVSKEVLTSKLRQLENRGLLDAGLAICQNGILKGYISQSNLLKALDRLAIQEQMDGLITHCTILKHGSLAENNISDLVDERPMMVGSTTPVEIIYEMFAKLGLRYLCVVEDGCLLGVIIKKRLLQFMHHK